MSLKRISLSNAIVIGLLLGILTGLFFGDLFSVFGLIGNGFIGLLQMTILPYIVVSLIAGIGSLTIEKAKILLFKGGIWLLIFWLISFIVVYLMILIFPNWESASFFSTSMIETQTDLNLLDIYIPSNPFSSLVHNYIPAIVIFCVLMGVALIYLPKKDALISVLTSIQDALIRMTGYIVKLTPIGVFALAADAAGKLSLGEITKLQVYIVGFILSTILLTFITLPGLIAVITPIRMKELLSLSKEIIITAFTTGNLFIVLPQMTELCKNLIHEKNLEKENSKYYVDILVPVSFNFPNIGKLLLLYFILFAMWFNSSPLQLEQVPSFTFTGLFTLFGGVDVALPFLLKIFQIPSDMYSLYVVTGIIIGRFSTMLAAMNLIAFTLLSTLSITGGTKLRLNRLFSFIGVNLMIFILFFLGLKLFFSNFVNNPYNKDEIISNMHNLQKPVKSFTNKTSPFGIVNEHEGMPVLDRIMLTGELRIGYEDDKMPFSFFNSRDELVGYNIDIANTLADELNAVPVYYKLAQDQFQKALNEEMVDIIIGAMATPTTMQYLNHTQPYMVINAALIIPDYNVKYFRKLSEIQKIKGLRIGINTGDTYLLEKIRKHFRYAEIIIIESNMALLRNEVDCILASAEDGSAWTLLNPQYKVVIPDGLSFRQTICFATKPDDYGWNNYLTNWIYLKKEGMQFQRYYNYWILGIDDSQKMKKWSIIKDVLHWTE